MDVERVYRRIPYRCLVYLTDAESLPSINKYTGVCSCHLCLHACNRSVFARGLSIGSRAYVIRKTRALANQNAVPHLRQPRRLSGHHV